MLVLFKNDIVHSMEESPLSIFMPSSAKEQYWMQRIVYSPVPSRCCKEAFMRELPPADHAVDYYLVRDLCIQFGARSIAFTIGSLYVKVDLFYNQVTMYLSDGSHVAATFDVWYDVLSRAGKIKQLPQALCSTLREFSKILDADRLPLRNALYRDHCRIQSDASDKSNGSIPTWMHRSKFGRSFHTYCEKK